MTELALQLFGPPRATRDATPIRFDTRKALALLAYLAVTGTPQSRDVLATLLWPEADQSRARATLRRTLSSATAVGPALQVHGDEIHLDKSLVWCDVVAFRGDSASDDAASWQSADALVNDTFLAGFSLRDSPVFDEWAGSTGDLLRAEHSAVLGRLVEAEASHGAFTTALAYARRRVVLDPLSEPAHVDLIRVTAESGDRPGALRHFRELVRVLDRELGVPPLPETVTLHEDIRANRIARAPSTTTDARTSATKEQTLSAGPAPLVGREHHRELMRSRLDESRAEGRVLGISGPTGSGRTALVNELSAAVEAAGGRVLRLTGHASEQHLALASGIDLIRALAPLAPSVSHHLAGEGSASRLPTLESGSDQRRLFEDVLTALTEAGATYGPVLLGIDDAQWVDAASTELLSFLARRQPAGVLTVATWNSHLSGAPLPAALRAIPCEVMSLPPLSEDDIEVLITRASAAGDLTAGEVLARTGGSPLLVTEYLAASPDARSSASAVRDVVATRFDTAPATTQQLVGAAVVLGGVSDPELLRHTCGRTDGETVDALEDAVARSLLVERGDGSGYDIPHELVRDVAAERTGLARTRLLHSRAADVLERRHASGNARTPAGAVARHLAAAGRDDEAARWHWLAAGESRRLYAHAETLEHARAAVGLGFDPAAGHLCAADALTLMGRYRAALLAYEQAAAFAEQPTGLAEIEHRIAQLNDRLGDWSAAEAHLEGALALIDGSDDHSRLARITADLALVNHRLGRDARAEELGALALEAARIAGDERGVAQALNVQGMVALADGRTSEALARLEPAVEAAATLDDPEPFVAALNNLSRAQLASADLDGARETALRALGLAERQGDRHRCAALHSQIADVLHAAGDEAGALDHLKASAAGFSDVQGDEIRAEIWTLTEW